VKQASRGAGSVRGSCHPEAVTQVRAGVTGAQEGPPIVEGSQHVGRRHLGGARALPMRNGPCRWKASAVRRVVTRHRVAMKLALAAPAREDPREGVTRST